MTHGVKTLLFAMVFVASTYGADNPIRLPELPIPSPIPQPMPGPTQAAKLNKTQLYVFDADVPLMVVTSPNGIVKVNKEEGPLKIFNTVFFDGTGKPETRSYKGKFIYTLEILETGKVELLIIPIGVETEDKILRRTIDVDSGEAPRPPPVDPVNPVDPVDPLMSALITAFKADGSPKMDTLALAAIYRNSDATVDNLAYKTFQDILVVMADAGQAVAPNPKLKATRRVIADELNVKIGREANTGLDDAQRNKIKTQFARMSKLLEALK